MKTINNILLVSLLLVCCNNDNTGIIEEKQPKCQIEADYESIQIRTRAKVDSIGRFSWTDDDLIGICGYKLTNNRFHYVKGGVSDKVFSGIFDFSSDSILFGYFPYQKDIVIKGDSLYFIIPEKTLFQDYVNMAPMIGYMVGSSKMSFKQTGALLYLSFKSLANDMSKVIVESKGDSRHYLSGKATVRIDSKLSHAYEIKTGSYKREFDLSFLDKDTCVHELFVPLQTGYYSNICVIIKNGQNDTLLSRSLSDISLVRATMVRLPLIDCIF